MTRSAEAAPVITCIHNTYLSQDFWRQKLLCHLQKMLSAGDYTPSQQSKHADFFSEWVVPLLGPMPLSVNGKSIPIYKSYMCDDHTPIEYSLSWKSGAAKPVVRFSIEPLPQDEQTEPSKILAYGLHSINILQRELQAQGSSLTDYLVLEPSLFVKILKRIGFYSGQKGEDVVSNIFLGFDLLPTQAQVKAYCVLKSSLDSAEKLALTARAISAYMPNMAFSTLLTYFQSKATDWHSKFSPDPFIIGVDCIGTDDARIKIYFRYQVTDFSQLIDQLSLGGTIPLSSEYIASLRDLWYRFIGQGSNSFLRTSHTSGILVYYEFSPCKPLPMAKVYLPVRLMAKNDRAIVDDVAEWFGDNAHFSNYKNTFSAAVFETWNDRELNHTIGTFTYVTLTSTGCAPGCYPSVYFSPTIFHLPLAEQKKKGPSISLRKPFSRMLHEAGSTTITIPDDCLGIAQTWFEAFSKQVKDPGPHFEHIFTPNGFWRDLIAFSRDIRTIHPRSSILEFLKVHSLDMQPRNLILLTAAGRTIMNSLSVIQGVFGLHTSVGDCSGVFTLLPTTSGEWKAMTIVIGLERIHNSITRFSDDMKIDATLLHSVDSPTQFPKVVVIGAGQAGLSVAARLENLGIPTLVIERRERVGDGWRNRYESLNINTPTTFSHLPFVPFPLEWPMFPSSDAVADHMEAYPRALGLHVLTSTSVLKTSYDDNSRTWAVQVRQGSGGLLTFHPQHLVLATGVDTLAGSRPRIPNIPKAGQFKGTTMHSTEFKNGKAWANKKVIVIGAGCSGHDIAQELHRRGASVTMVQRSSTSVVSRKMLLALFPDLYTGDHQPPTSVADRLFLSFPITVTRSLQHEIMKKMASLDEDLLNNLRQRGFLLPDEDDNFFERLMIRRGGYYIDQGCSSLIIKNEIDLKAGVAIVAYTPSGILFADGTEVQADLVVYATGFHQESLIEISSRLLDYDLRDKGDSAGGWDVEYEMAGLWRPTPHRGLWFAGGDLFTCRFYSRLLAMQIKAVEEGLFEGNSQARV